MSATISAAEVKHLQVNPSVRAVVPDTMRHFASLGSGPGPALPALAKSGRTAKLESTGTQQICPSNPAQPLIEPEAREVMNVAAAEQITDGSGVKVGIIADGIDPNNPDLIRANGQHVIFDYQDFSGFGTNAPTDGREAFLDAGTIASQGNQTYDLSGFVNPAHPLPAGCNIKIEGIAPGASLAVMNLPGSGPGVLQLHDHPGHPVGRPARPRQHPQRVLRRQPAAQRGPTTRSRWPTTPRSPRASPSSPPPATAGRSTTSARRPPIRT